MHIAGCGGKKTAVLSSITIQMAISSPSRSNPGLHRYVALLPSETLAYSTSPLVGGAGAEHSAVMLVLTVPV